MDDDELSCLFSSRMTVSKDQVQQLQCNLDDVRRFNRSCTSLVFRLREKISQYLEHIQFESQEEKRIQHLLTRAMEERDFFHFLSLCEEAFTSILGAIE